MTTFTLIFLVMPNLNITCTCISSAMSSDQEFVSMINFIDEKLAEIDNILAFIASNKLNKTEKDRINQDLKQLYSTVKEARAILDEMVFQFD